VNVLLLLRVVLVLVNLLSQRQEIEETIDRLGLHIDAKEWPELGEILSELVELDYVSLFGGQIEHLSREQVISKWKMNLTPLKATQHIITNLHITIRDNMAECATNVVATHVRPNPTGDSLWTVGGRYDFRLMLESGRWKISAIKLTVLWMTGNPQVLGPSSSEQTLLGGGVG
jgi:hypothetical protein